MVHSVAAREPIVESILSFTRSHKLASGIHQSRAYLASRSNVIGSLSVPPALKTRGWYSLAPALVAADRVFAIHDEHPATIAFSQFHRSFSLPSRADKEKGWRFESPPLAVGGPSSGAPTLEGTGTIRSDRTRTAQTDYSDSGRVCQRQISPFVGNTGYVRSMYQMICPVLEVIQAMEGLDVSDGAGTGAEIDEVRRGLWAHPSRCSGSGGGGGDTGYLRAHLPALARSLRGRGRGGLRPVRRRVNPLTCVVSAAAFSGASSSSVALASSSSSWSSSWSRRRCLRSEREPKNSRRSFSMVSFRKAISAAASDTFAAATAARASASVAFASALDALTSAAARAVFRAAMLVPPSIGGIESQHPIRRYNNLGG